MCRGLLVSLVASALWCGDAIAASADTAGVNDGRTGVVAGTADSPAGRVTGQCAFRFNVPEYIPMMVRGTAVAGGMSLPVTTSVRCVVRNRNGAPALDRTGTAPGPVATTAGSGLGPANLPPFTVCAGASATWPDGTSTVWPGPGATDLACTAPVR